MSDLRPWLFKDGWAGTEYWSLMRFRLSLILRIFYLRNQGNEVLIQFLPQHHRCHCHLQRHQNGLLALPFSNMVRKSWICNIVVHLITKGTESTCSSHRSFSSHYWPLLMQRSTTKASKSFRFSYHREIAVVHHLVLSRVSSQLRRECTCSNTFTATPSRWPYMVTPYPTAQLVFNRCFYAKENVY